MALLNFQKIHLDSVMREKKMAIAEQFPFGLQCAICLHYTGSWKSLLYTPFSGLQADVGCLAGVGPVSLPSVLMTAWPQQSVIKAEKTLHNTTGRGTSLYNEQCARGRETAPAVASLWEQAPPPAVGRTVLNVYSVQCRAQSAVCTVRCAVRA